MARSPEKLREDYYRFHRIQVECGDMDPVYPVLKEIADRLGLDRERRLWLLIVFTAYYHLGSALAAFSEVPDPARAEDAALDLPCATERRGHWSRPRLRAHLEAVQEIAYGPGGLSGYFTGSLWACTPEDGWRLVQHRASSIPGNGRWASFKTTELIKEVVGLRLSAPDMQHAHSSGPRKGLALLHPGLPEGNGPAEIALLDTYSRALVGDMRAHRLPVEVETAETSLCDFYSMTRGSYYPGHDIDKMMLQLEALGSGPLIPLAYEARRAVLPRAYLGELNGRRGIDKGRSVHYRITGEILERGRDT